MYRKKYIYSSLEIALNKLTVLTPGILMTQGGEKGKKGVERGTGRQRTAEKMAEKKGKGVGGMACSYGFIT